ncbi:MAG: helix-turn-helix domain-containing protein, partial [Melioribacteraceae bacterium]
GLTNSLPYLYGPLIYLYVISLTRKQYSFTKYNYFHFLPFLIIQVYSFFFFYFESAEYQMKLLNFNSEQVWHIQLIGNLIPLHGSIYIAAAIKEVIKFNRKIKDSFSQIDNLDLSWLLYLVGGTLVVWLVVIFAYIFNFIFSDALLANMVIYIVLSIFLYSLAIKSYRQPEIEKIINIKKEDEGLYKKSGLSTEKADTYLMSLEKLMNEEKPYLEPSLGLAQLAEQLNISTHNLSELINTKLNQNFYDFINSYRVKEVKKLIEEDKTLTYSILAHGYEAGFTSKSAYYAAFKKFTEKTPAQYRKEI